MARNIKDIYDQMAAEKAAMSQLDVYLVDEADSTSTLDNTQRLLNDLSTPSKVAVWRLLLWVVAFGIWIHEMLWDVFKAEVDSIVASAIPGIPRWYQRETLKFQYGYQLVWDGKKYVYPTIDTNAQIITRCAIQDNGGVIRVKVAKGTVPIQLDAAEELALNSYLQQIKFAGSNVLLINFPSDLIRFQIDILYNPQVELTLIKTAVEAAIENYLSNLEFNGKFIVSHLVDRLQALDGVVIPDVNNIDYVTASNPLWVPIENEYQTVAGYAKISPLFAFGSNYINGQPVLKYIPYS